jgi:hypothetical protein
MKGKWLILATVLMVVCLHQAGSALTPLPSDEYLTGKFQAADTDGDGRLSRREYLAMWRYDQEQGKKQFQKLDKDRDGSITLEEYGRGGKNRSPVIKRGSNQAAVKKGAHAGADLGVRPGKGPTRRSALTWEFWIFRAT